MGNCWTEFCRQNQLVDENQGEMKLATGNVHLITSWETWEAKQSEASKDNKIVVANFSAPWSNPCRTIAPAYCDLADKHPSLMFLTVDVDQLAELAAKWEVKATPTFFFLRDGRQLDKLVGGTKEELQRKTAAIADLASRSEN